MRTSFEESVKLYEEMASSLETIPSPERISPTFAQENAKLAKELRQKAVTMQKQIAECKQRERELWEDQPGGITAPPPRPVHRR